MKSSKNLRCGVAAAMFAALTCVLTMFIKIPIMGGQGYIHPGDMVIYLAASILPLPFAAAGAGNRRSTCRYSRRCCRLGTVDSLHKGCSYGILYP